MASHGTRLALPTAFRDAPALPPPARSPSRRAGLLVPLFSIASSRSWGIGEIGDIGAMARWLETAGFRLLQLLPINEMPPSDTSPYSALSAMAIDPQFIALDLLEDFAALGGEQRLEADLRARLDTVRASPGVDYANVRDLKQIVLRRSFARFRDARVGRRHATGRGAPRLYPRAGLVARRIRALSRAARARGRAAVARLARSRFADASRPRSRRRGSSSPTTSCTASTCSGSPTISGRRRARHPAASRCSGICRSW